jgi:hypothetical protein
MTMPVEAQELKLTDEIKEAVNGALMNGTPIIVAYVDAEGQPSLSFRGSTQAYGDQQLAFWARKAEGGIVDAIQERPRVTFFYRDAQKRTTIQFRGRAHVDNSDATREHVYTHAPEQEQRVDPERKGTPVIIDLDRVEGMMAGSRIQMKRE